MLFSTESRVVIDLQRGDASDLADMIMDITLDVDQGGTTWTQNAIQDAMSNVWEASLSEEGHDRFMLIISDGMTAPDTPDGQSQDPCAEIESVISYGIGVTSFVGESADCTVANYTENVASISSASFTSYLVTIKRVLVLNL